MLREDLPSVKGYDLPQGDTFFRSVLAHEASAPLLNAAILVSEEDATMEESWQGEDVGLAGIGRRYPLIALRMAIDSLCVLNSDSLSLSHHMSCCVVM